MDEPQVFNQSSNTGPSVQSGSIQGGVHFHGTAAPKRTVPRQLPGALRHFIDRALEQDMLTTLLNSAASDGMVLLSTVDGIAGVGKSTLAVHWAHRMRDRFPDGELYVNLRGFDPVAEPMEAGEALSGFLTALEVPRERIPDDVDARSAMLRSELHSRRMLIVLDNARSAAQIRPLLPGGSTCFAVVTSRNRLDELIVREGATRLALEVLEHEKSRALLGRYLGEERIEAESEGADQLIEHCAGLPLALGVVAMRAAENPDFPLSVLVDELAHERERLDALESGGETGVRAVFSWSYRGLSAGAARMFRLLGLPTGPDIGVAAAADLAGVEQREVRTLLGELVRANLLDVSVPGRYRFHDLLRAYAAECAHTDETETERHAALRRLLDHYLRTSDRVQRRLVGHSRVFTPNLPESAITGLSFDTEDEALAWWDTERFCLRAAIHHASSLGMLAHTWQITYTLMYFFHLRGYVPEWIDALELARTAARELGDRRAEAHLSHDHSVAEFDRKHYDHAIQHAEHALSLFEELEDPYWQAESLIDIGIQTLDAGRHADALAPLRRALDLADQVDSLYVKGMAHEAFGYLHAILGPVETAAEHLEQALVLLRESGEQYGEGYALHNLALAHANAGQWEKAAEFYRQAATRRQEFGHRPGEAESLNERGEMLRQLGDLEGARECWSRAADLFRELDHPDADTVRGKLDGLATA